jgi:predicted transcriptional regulator
MRSLASYTIGMKTAISIPDDLFREADALATKLGRSRSSVYASAVREYLSRHATDDVTDALNAVCDDVGDEGLDFVNAAAAHVFRSVEW